jgi:hypothetical protein
MSLILYTPNHLQQMEWWATCSGLRFRILNVHEIFIYELLLLYFH